MTFKDFEMEGDKPTCLWDVLYVFDGSNVGDPNLLYTCGTGLPQEIVSSSDSLLIHFK